MSTKLKGDIAEQAAILHALRKGWGVLQPVGDRLPYDLVFDIDDVFCKIQVKAAWFHEASKNYVIDNSIDAAVEYAETILGQDLFFQILALGRRAIAPMTRQCFVKAATVDQGHRAASGQKSAASTCAIE